MFIGRTDDWRAPLFEVVLVEKGIHIVDRWTPHFQIDIDSELPIEDLRTNLKEHFGSGFDWTLNVPGVGVVLGMKILGSVNGTKICLGVGTNLRNTEYHRKTILKPLRTR